MQQPRLYSSQTYGSNTARTASQDATSAFCRQHKVIQLIGESTRRARGPSVFSVCQISIITFLTDISRTAPVRELRFGIRDIYIPAEMPNWYFRRANTWCCHYNHRKIEQTQTDLTASIHRVRLVIHYVRYSAVLFRVMNIFTSLCVTYPT